MQITAEQILREAKERQLEAVPPPPNQTISDPDELAQTQLVKRKEFEDRIRRTRGNMNIWLKYAHWEDTQGNVDRARSVFERALDVDPRAPQVWIKYAEMEMSRQQINHARNVYDRAVALLPRVNQLWYKYTYMEELLGNIVGARQLFERWMQWHPEEQAWYSFINMEMRYNQHENARSIYERLVIEHIDVKNWIKFAKFEQSLGEYDRCRKVYERAVEFFGKDHMDEALFIAFARFEEASKEYERARVIYKYALDNIPQAKSRQLFDAYTQFEKKFGERNDVESVIYSKRKFQYEEALKQNSLAYDVWFDYLKLSESEGDIEKTRDVYERAIANVPPSTEKRMWRRYIYLWINYAIFEELEAKDVARARSVYRACLDCIPHAHFTFAKVWLLAANLEVRAKDLKAARSLLGNAIGRCPKEKLFKGYIELELSLREFDRCRTLYDKYLLFSPANCETWKKYAELEAILGDIDRARSIYELAISQPLLDMPEVVWKAYIDMETELGEIDRTRDLYERLLAKTSHVKVWISYAAFESSVAGEDAIEQARHVYETADKEVRKSSDKAERKLLLEAWLKFEQEHGDREKIDAVRSKMPKQVKRRREVFAEDGSSEGWEEYWDYVYPDEQSGKPQLKLLDLAHKWKASQKGVPVPGGFSLPIPTTSGDDDSSVSLPPPPPEDADDGEEGDGGMEGGMTGPGFEDEDEDEGRY